MQIIKTGWKRAVSAIKEHKWLFVILVLLQAVLIVSGGFVLLDYQLKIFADIQAISVPLAQANYNQTSIQQGLPFMENLLPVVRSYQNMIWHFLEMVFWLAGLFVFLNGGIWLLVHWMVKKPGEKLGFLKILNQWLKYLISSLVAGLPLAVLGYLLFKVFFSLGIGPDSEQFRLAFQILPYLAMIEYYFLLVAIALVNIESWQAFARKWFECSVKKIYLTLIVLLINLILILIGLGLIYLAMSYESVSWLLFILTPVFLAGWAFARIFWVSSLQELAEEK